MNKQQLISVGKGALIAMGGALCTYLLEVLPGLDFGEFTPAVVAGISILINLLRKKFFETK